MATASTPKKTLTEFGYGFNSAGQMRKIDPETGDVTDSPFEFTSQQDYEDLGESVTEYVYELLEKNGLHRIYVPFNHPPEKSTFVFSTQKELKDINKLMVIIHGSGVVRAGQC